VILVQAIVPDIQTDVTKTEVIIGTVIAIALVFLLDKIIPRKRK
jgi:hypothetical protein